jgi:hypothetical protein
LGISSPSLLSWWTINAKQAEQRMSPATQSAARLGKELLNLPESET